MSDNRTELEKRNVLRLSNEESNKITRECIQTALIHLLSEKDMDKISITEIVSRAGVSRTAFYRNYSSKEAVLSSYSEELLNGLNRFGLQAITERDPHIIYENVFSTVKNNSKRFSLLLKAGFLDRDLMDIRGFIISKYDKLDTQVQHMIFGWSGMIKNIVIDWYLGGMKEDIASMSELCCILSEGVVNHIKSIDPSFTETISNITE